MKTSLSATNFASWGWLFPVKSLIEFVAILLSSLLTVLLKEEKKSGVKKERADRRCVGAARTFKTAKGVSCTRLTMYKNMSKRIS